MGTIQDQELSQTELVKKEFSHIESRYFNSAYFGPSPYRSQQKVMRALYKELDPSHIDFDQFFFGVPEQIRSQIAFLLNTDSEHIALSTASSDLVSMVAQGLKFKDDDIACVIRGEYPSNVLPWMVANKTRGIQLEFLDVPIPTGDWIRKNIPKKTKVITMTHVAFDTGRRIDIEDVGKALKEKDILFILDATQSLGGLPISKEELQYVDVLVCSTYKWILGPYGAAFGYFSDKALKQIEHLTGNWITSPSSKDGNSLLNYTIETLPGARRFDRGQSPNALVNGCLSAALQVLNEIGLDKIEANNKHIRDHFLANFPKSKFEVKTPVDHMGNILSLSSTKLDPLTLERNLKQANFDVSVREGNLRLSFHLFNSIKQVEALIETLDQ